MAGKLDKQYWTYMSTIPPHNQAKPRQVLDGNHDGVDTHLVRLASDMTDWEGILATELELTATQISDIRTLHKSNPTQERYVYLTYLSLFTIGRHC